MRFYRQSVDNSEPSNVFNYTCSNPLPVALQVLNGLVTALCLFFFFFMLALSHACHAFVRVPVSRARQALEQSMNKATRLEDRHHDGYNKQQKYWPGPGLTSSDLNDGFSKFVMYKFLVYLLIDNMNMLFV